MRQAREKWNVVVKFGNGLLSEFHGTGKMVGDISFVTTRFQKTPEEAPRLGLV